MIIVEVRHHYIIKKVNWFVGSLALYNASDEGFQLIRFLSNTVATGAKFGPHLLSVSEDSLRLAFIGPLEYTVTVADARSLDEVG